MKTKHPNQPERTREGAPDTERDDVDRALVDEHWDTDPRGRRTLVDTPDQPDDPDDPDGDAHPPEGDTHMRDGDGLPVSAPKK